MQTVKESRCFSCGALVQEVDGPVHRYLDSSPGCWAAFGAVLAREYSEVMYARNHNLTVDAYALQHPGTSSPQSIQSIAVHLANLFMFFESGKTMPKPTQFIQKLVEHKSAFFWLEHPADLGAVTVRDVLEAKDAQTHLRTVEEWAESAWSAWKKHHNQVKEWVTLCARGT